MGYWDLYNWEQYQDLALATYSFGGGAVNEFWRGRNRERHGAGQKVVRHWGDLKPQSMLLHLALVTLSSSWPQLASVHRDFRKFVLFFPWKLLRVQ